MKIWKRNVCTSETIGPMQKLLVANVGRGGLQNFSTGYYYKLLMMGKPAAGVGVRVAVCVVCMMGIFIAEWYRWFAPIRPLT